MVTGKNEDRYKFVEIALANFKQQTYPNKHLIIINHGQKSLNEIQNQNITVIPFDKAHMTLGDMRNFSLEMVPINSLWTIWDDDDWRHKRYLELLVKALLDNKADAVFFKNRLDFNINTGYVYRSTFEKGMPFVLCKKFEVIRYLSKDSLEDIRLYNDLELHNKKIVLLDNDPRWYVRTIHEANTSLYVDKNKTSTVNYSKESSYHEYTATQKEDSYARKIIEIYFRNI
jgi:hypothetical protein